MAIETRPAPQPIPLRDVRAMASKAMDIRARVGMAGIAVRSAQRLPRAVAVTEWYAVFDTHPRLRPPVVEATEETIRWATDEDRAALVALTGSEESVRARLARGDEAIVVEIDGRVVAQAWFTAREYDESNLIFPVRPWERWLYDGRVHDDMRGRGIHPRMVSAAASALADRGVTRIISTVDHLNTASQRAAAKRGARVIGSVLSTTAGPLTVSRVQWVGERARWRVHRGARRLTPPGV